MEVYTHADNSSCIEHAVYSGLGVIAHDEAAELQVSPHEALRGIVPYPYLRIIVLEIARISACSYVAPLPYHGVAEVAVVRLVAESEHDSIVDLSADLAIGAESGTTINLRSHPDLCIVADSKRTSQASALHDMRSSSYIYRAVLEVKHRTFDHRARLDE